MIDIRSEVGKLVGAPQPGQKGAVALVSTPADALLTTSQRNHLGPNLPPPSREVSARGGRAAGGPGAGQLGQPLQQPEAGQKQRPGQEIATLQVSEASSTRAVQSQTWCSQAAYARTCLWSARPPHHCAGLGSAAHQLLTVLHRPGPPPSLQVKSEDGGKTYILKLQYDDTVFALRKCIDTHRAALAKEQGMPAPGAKYEIRSAFPTRAYTEAKETLREAGLVPNATLFLRAL